MDNLRMRIDRLQHEITEEGRAILRKYQGDLTSTLVKKLEALPKPLTRKHVINAFLNDLLWRRL